MTKKFNFYLGAAASSWLLAVLVIAAELSEPFKTLLKTIFTHHWIGKAVIITLAFIAFGFVLPEKKSRNQDKDVAWYSVLGSLIIIFLFYVIKFFA